MKFRRQQPIGPFIVDLYCKEFAIAVEADGPVHQEQRDRDARRDAWLAARGVLVLRFTNEEILRDPHRVSLAIVQAAKERAAKPAHRE